MLEAIERALRRTPLPRGVALTMRKDDISRPLVAQQPDGSWQASIYAVRKNGLPLWWPKAANRPRPQRFVAKFVAQASELTNMLRVHSAAQVLLEMAEGKLRNRRSGLRAARARRRGAGFHKGPGRPRGILRSMEKTGSNRDRLCVRCEVRHHNQKRCPQGESS
jgi:hypothetical protein